LGELEFSAYQSGGGEYVSTGFVDNAGLDKRTGEAVMPVTVSDDDVEKRGDAWVFKSSPDVQVLARSYKMSKSRGNVVNPDDVIDQYGADSLRLYEMFLGPLEQVKPWSTRGVEGVYRFLNRVWRMLTEDDERLNPNVQDVEPAKDQLRDLHRLIQKVTDDIEDLRMNTAIAAMMEFSNAARGWKPLPKSVAETFVKLLNPFAPHITEELWSLLGHESSIAYEPWPELVEAYLVEDEIDLAVQVMGKVRATIRVAADAGREAVLATARADENVARHLEGKTIRKEIYVPGRIVNFVAT
ncbi:MAG: class I tRNA ligase family protein, partial [Bacteroidota bacterium]